MPGDENKQSLKERGLTFEKVLSAHILGFIPNPVYPEQFLLIVEIEGYAVVAPCENVGNDTWRIITAYQSRKYTKHYLKK